MTNKKYVLRVRAADREIFQLIEDGNKKVETRGGSPKFNRISEGDKLVFMCEGSKFEKLVIKVSHYKSIDKMLEDYKVGDIHPKLKSKEELIELYHSFPGYKEKIKKFGILAFELE